MGNSTNSFRLSAFSWLGMCSHWRFHVGELARIKRIELKSHSRSPVSQGVARSGTAEWRPYRSSIHINATNAEPRTSWLLQSSTSRGPAHIRVRSIRVRASPIRPSPLHRRILADMDALFCFGGYRHALRSFGALPALGEFLGIQSQQQDLETRLSFSCFLVRRVLQVCSSTFAGLPATTVRSIPNSVGTGNTPTFAGVAGSSALYLHS
jgi:hypothetical protein